MPRAHLRRGGGRRRIAWLRLDLTLPIGLRRGPVRQGPVVAIGIRRIRRGPALRRQPTHLHRERSTPRAAVSVDYTKDNQPYAKGCRLVGRQRPVVMHACMFN
jgi:hypothetical protein